MARAFSPSEVKKLKIKTLPLEGEWKEAFGTPSTTETWFISGPSASGKSSFVMKLAKMLTKFGNVLYVALEEPPKTSKSFQDRVIRLRMNEVNKRIFFVTEGIEEIYERLEKQRSPQFIIIDSFQYLDIGFKEAKNLIDSFPNKCFIFISQESGNKPIGKAAIKIKFEAGLKIRTNGYRAICEGRYIENPAAFYTIWEEGANKFWNKI